MNGMKKISAALACAMMLSVFAAGCSKAEEDSQPVTPNVITSAADGGAPADSGNAGADGSAPTAAVNLPDYETQIVTDEDGNTATGIDGGVLTEAVNYPSESAQTMAPEDIQNLATAAATKPVAVVDTSVDNTTRYAYNTLDKNEQALYDAILDAATKLQHKIRVTDAVTTERWTKVFGMVYNQEPQLFWLNKKIKVGKLYYNETDTDKIKTMQKEIDATTDKLLKEASGKSTAEKLKIFHDHIVLNSTFEKSADVGSYNESIYNAFKDGTSKQGNIQCSGYAKSMLYLCDKAGIDCMVIVGTDANGNSHAWNKVKVEGEWYNLDTTWDDPILSTPVYNYLRYNFFLVPDEWINNKTHCNINVKELNTGSKITYFDPPKATATAQNYFIKNGFVYKDVDSAEKALKSELEKAAADGRTVAEVMVGSKDVYNTLKSRLTTYQSDLTGKYSNVKGIADNCNENMLVVQADVKYK